jgi:hypothetical protein
MLQTNLETLLFVASYDIVSYYRLLNTDPGPDHDTSNGLRRMEWFWQQKIRNRKFN